MIMRKGYHRIHSDRALTSAPGPAVAVCEINFRTTRHGLRSVRSGFGFGVRCQR